MNVVTRSSVPRIAFAMPAVSPLVLLYHSVVEHPHGGLEIAPEVLQRQLYRLLARGLRPLTISEALAERNGCVAVTFDDGSKSIRDVALPLLGELGMTATAFVPTEPGARLGRLTTADLGVLVDAGWEIGSHCITHRRLTELDDGQLCEELEGSRVTLEAELGRPCRAVSYPFGAADARVVAAARAAGYTVGCTVLGEASLPPAPLCWPRVGIDGREPMLAFRLRASVAVRALRVAVRR